MQQDYTNEPNTSINRQAIFNKVCEHLITQNAKSVSKSFAKNYNDIVPDTCNYRGENNTMCAIGCLIKDEFYHKRLEGSTTFDEKIQNALARSGIHYKMSIRSDNSSEFLENIQSIHDFYPVNEWKEKLREFADTWELDQPAIIKEDA